MSTTDERLREGLQAIAPHPSTGDVPGALERRRHRRRRNQRALVAITGVVAILAVAVMSVVVLRSSDDDATTVIAGEPEDVSTAQLPEHIDQWRPIAPSPLSPRADARGVWTGSEVVVIGGTDQPCPENARCRYQAPLADAAAYDPATDTWRMLDFPDEYEPIGQPAAVDRTVYVPAGQIAPPHTTALLVLDVATGTWQIVAAPPATSELATSAGELFAFTVQPVEIHRYDAAGSKWTPIPAPPFDTSSDSAVVATDHGLIVLAATFWGSSDPPSAVAAARYDVESGEWERLTDAPLAYASGYWRPVGAKLVNPTPGAVDGAEASPFDHGYALGATLDIAGGTWTDISPRPEGGRGVRFASWAGSSTGQLDSWALTSDGWLYDPLSRAWYALPDEPLHPRSRTTTVAFGDRIFVWGGVRWNDGVPDLFAGGAIYQAPSPPDAKPSTPQATITGSLDDGRTWSVTLTETGNLCSTIGSVDVGCTPLPDPRWAPIAAAADAGPYPEDDSAQLVYGLLAPGAGQVVLRHGDGRTITAGITVDPISRIWVAVLEPGDNPDAVAYLDAAGATVAERRFYR